MESKKRAFSRWCIGHKDAVVGIVIFLFGLVMFISASHIKALFSAQAVTSGFFPKLIGIMFMGLALIMVIGDLQKENCGADETVSVIHAESLEDVQKLVGVKADEDALSAEQKAEGNLSARRGSTGRIWVSIGLLLFYLAALKDVGFVITSTTFITCQALVLTKKELRKKYWIHWLIVAIVLSVGVYYMFRYVLYLFLPAGILG